jgi:hypothetical protein
VTKVPNGDVRPVKHQYFNEIKGSRKEKEIKERRKNREKDDEAGLGSRGG